MNQELRSPEEIFDGDHLPDDLKWIMAHFGLPKNDPFVVLLAWHWHRVQNGKDTLHDAQVQIAKLLDERINRLEAMAARNQAVGDQLKSLETLLSGSPEKLTKQWEEKLCESLQANIAAGNKLSATLIKILPTVDTALKRLRWHQMLAMFFSGLFAGSFIAIWIYSVLFTHS